MTPNGFIMRNGNFIECPIGATHLEFLRRLGYKTAEDAWKGGLLRWSYIGKLFIAEGDDVSWYQFLFIKNRCLESRCGVGITLFDMIDYVEISSDEIREIETLSDFIRFLSFKDCHPSGGRK